MVYSMMQYTDNTKAFPPPPLKSQFYSSGVNVILFKPEGKLCPNPVHGTLDVGHFFCNVILKKVLQIHTLNCN